MVKNLEEKFILYCNSENLEVSQNQILVVKKLYDYYKYNFKQNIIKKIEIFLFNNTINDFMQCINSNYECPICMDKQINLRLIDTYEKCSMCSTIFSPTIICNECFKHCSNACPFCRSENQDVDYYGPINSVDKIDAELK